MSFFNKVLRSRLALLLLFVIGIFGDSDFSDCSIDLESQLAISSKELATPAKDRQQIIGERVE